MPDFAEEVDRLHRLYPTIPIPSFMLILQRVGLENTVALGDELDKAERRIVRCVSKHQRMEQHRTASEIKKLARLEAHRGLIINIQKLPVLHVNVQIVLVYGFARVGSKALFSGRHWLMPNSVMQNLSRKLDQLGRPLDRATMKATLDYLIRQGAVTVHRGQNGPLSLTVDEHAAGVTQVGLEIIRAVKKFFHGRLRS